LNSSRPESIEFQRILAKCTEFVNPAHALYIGQLFSGFSGISKTHLSLGFDIPLLLRLILLAFLILILWVVGLTKSALQVRIIFLDLLLFAGSQKQSSVAQSTTEA
jgi:hypothetical protein